MTRVLLPPAGVHRGDMAKWLVRRGATAAADVIGSYSWWIRLKNEDLAPQSPGAFTGWTDSSGNGRDISHSNSLATLSVATDASDFPAIDFVQAEDGAIAYQLQGGEGAAIQAWDGMTLFAVFRQDQIDDHTVIGFNAANDRTEGIWAFIQNSPDTIGMYEQAASTFAYNYVDTPVAHNTNLQVLAWRWTWSAGPTLVGNIWVNGTKYDMFSEPEVWWHDGPSAGTGEPAAPGVFVIGARYAISPLATFEECDGKFLEGMAIGTSLADADVAAISAALMAKFSI